MVTPHPNQVDFLGMVDPWNLGLLKHTGRVSFFLGGGRWTSKKCMQNWERCSCSHGWTASKKIPRHRTTKKHSTTMISAKGEEGTHLGCWPDGGVDLFFFFVFFSCLGKTTWHRGDSGPSPGRVLVFCLGGRSWASTLDPAPSTRTGRNVLSKNTNSKVSPRRCFCKGFARCRHFLQFWAFSAKFSRYSSIGTYMILVKDWMVTWNRSQIFSRFCVQSGYTAAVANEPFSHSLSFFFRNGVTLLGKWKTSIQVFHDICTV